MTQNMEVFKGMRIEKKEAMTREKANILGVNITRMNMAQAIEAVKHSIQKKHKLLIFFPNVFVITECNRNEAYRKIINSADIVLADSWPLVWASYFLGRYTGGKVGGPEFFSKLNITAEKEGYSCYYLGGGPGGSEKVVENLKKKHPSLKIAGNFSPPLGEISNQLTDEIIEMINKAKPDILWVGLGAPRQERWTRKNFNRLHVNIAICVGAAFYYEAGIKRKAPRWINKIGLEWSYRILFQDITLLWRKRYYAYLWEFILPVLYKIMKERISIFKKGH